MIDRYRIFSKEIALIPVFSLSNSDFRNVVLNCILTFFSLNVCVYCWNIFCRFSFVSCLVIRDRCSRLLINDITLTMIEGRGVTFVVFSWDSYYIF